MSAPHQLPLGALSATERTTPINLSHHRRVLFSAGIGCALLASCIITAPAFADESPAPSDTNPSADVDHVALSAPLDLANAQALAAQNPSLNVVGYGYDNGQVVGEFFPGDESQDTFLADFSATYGTAPAVTTLVAVDEDSAAGAGGQQTATKEQRQLAKRQPSQRRVLQTHRRAFHPTAVSKVLLGRLFASKANFPRSRSAEEVAPDTIAHGSWAPDTVSVKISRSSSHQYIENDLTWDEGSNNNVPSGFGMEVGVTLLRTKDGDDKAKWGVRGAVFPQKICEIGFRDAFVAKNYSFNSWSATSSKGKVGAGHAYADYNDALDSCYSNSMTIGFQYPRLIPGDKLITKIDAKKGTTNTSYVQGDVELVHNDCDNNPQSLTDCMGESEQKPPASAHNPRTTLGSTHLWIADPELCWKSTAFGGSAPTLIGCP